MNLTSGSRVLRISRPWGEPGEIRHVDGDTCWVVWSDGKMGSINRLELCGFENIAQPAVAKKRKRARPELKAHR